MQIVNNEIVNKILYEFLKQYCMLENNYYMIDKFTYKKYEYYNIITMFKISLKNIYTKSKQRYLDSKNTYNNLLTIVRQICKQNNIKYVSKIRYDKSKYDIIYYIENIE
tara:strand:+ start:2080 stop:2406 length:327 start_codon:yes stop_codon:yes gene_type:complete